MRKIIFCLILVFSLFIVVSCNNENNNNNQEFKRVNIEPDEYGSDVMGELPDGYVLVWADEFNYTGSPDSAKWNYEVGAGGWGNNELQCYTARDDNSYVSDGHLTITAKKESYSGSSYTSARITTKNKGDFKYGYIEMRAKLPTGVGTWPAFWMMPTDSAYGGWPHSGEIDIMETTGKNPSYIQGTTHTTNSGSGGRGGATFQTNSTTEWNRYAIRWTEKSIQFLVNDKVYYTYVHSTGASTADWPFDQRFFIILNIAMGGNMGGTVDSNFESAQMLVDYVRVYKQVDTTDTEAPEKPEIKSFVSSYDSIYLTWDTPLDNQGIKQYDIVLNNKQIGATVSNSYTIKGLKEATSYDVRLIAVDYNNNWTISDVFRISTLTQPKVPGVLYGYAYSEASRVVKIVTGSDSDKGNVLQIPANTTITFNSSVTRSGSYNVKLRLLTQISSNLKIEVFEGENLIFSEEAVTGNSYGRYNDLALTGKLDLSGKDITIKLTCTASTSGNAILLNYLTIE